MLHQRTPTVKSACCLPPHEGQRCPREPRRVRQEWSRGCVPPPSYLGQLAPRGPGGLHGRRVRHRCAVSPHVFLACAGSGPWASPLRRPSVTASVSPMGTPSCTTPTSLPPSLLPGSAHLFPISVIFHFKNVL